MEHVFEKDKGIGEWNEWNRIKRGKLKKKKKRQEKGEKYDKGKNIVEKVKYTLCDVSAFVCGAHYQRNDKKRRMNKKKRKKVSCSLF